MYLDAAKALPWAVTFGDEAGRGVGVGGTRGIVCLASLTAHLIDTLTIAVLVRAYLCRCVVTDDFLGFFCDAVPMLA